MDLLPSPERDEIVASAATFLRGTLPTTRTRELIEAAGAAVLFLPPYSPDLNPIEMIFAKIKQLLRSLACRTREGLWAVMQSVLDQITASDAANCFRHCGYTLQMN